MMSSYDNNCIYKKNNKKPCYNIKTGKYVDMVKEGIIDPTKVTRTALENAVSVAGTMLITECTVVEKPKKETEGTPGLPPGVTMG